MKRTSGLAIILSILLAASAAAAAGGAMIGKPGSTETATFAGGCFWCMEPPYDKLPGVLKTTVGYTGGHKQNPTYEEVSAGGTGHAESVEIVFDPSKVSYDKLLDIFWRNIDPLVKDRQFCDLGTQYRTAIFYHGEAQRKAAEASKKLIEEAKGWKVATQIVPASTFWPAEEYHQDYHDKNPIRYKYYRFGCGRDQRLDELWGREAR
jgi:peptide-methionine (S)-S-oxide reductase